MNRKIQTKTKKKDRNRPSSKKNKSNTDGVLSAPNRYVNLPGRSALIVSDRITTRLSYAGISALAVPLGGVAAIRYRPTAVFDVDPLLGSTSVPGFNELAALFFNYRVFMSMIKIKVVGGIAPTSVVLLPLNADPTGAPGALTVQSWTSNSYRDFKLVPASGGPVTNLSCTMSTEKIFGSKMVLFDDNFASATGTIPVNNWYWAIGAINSAGGAATTCTLTVEIDMGVEFFTRRTVLQ
jgi:hypothetical protein